MAASVSTSRGLSRRQVLGAASVAGIGRWPRSPADRVIRVASPLPAGAIDPLTVSEPGGAMMLCQTGEFLVMDDPDLTLRPALALRWAPNGDASIWVFALRPGVTFHDGTPFTAADVVATFDRLSDPRLGSNALSVLRGVLSPGGARRIDDLTVAFHLDAPNGRFPYCVSNDNYNAIILPASFRGDYERDFIGTGPFRLDRYTPKSGASFVRHDTYWGAKALPARIEFSFFADQAPQILALEDEQVDVIAQISAQSGRGLLRNPRARIIDLPSSMHRQIHMRCDRGPFADKRVRQAVALMLDRAGLVQGLFDRHAAQGNDSPFAPIYGADDAVPQRIRDPDRARALLSQAGYVQGFAAVLTADRYQEIPDLAVVVQNACAEIGIRLTLRIEDPAIYYGTAQRGSSDWLDSDMGITEYGHRGIPDAILSAALTTDGSWNAAHFTDSAYDRLVASYTAAIDDAARRETARAIEMLLLEETPIVVPYFCDYLVATSAQVTGVHASAISQIFLQNAAIA